MATELSSHEKFFPTSLLLFFVLYPKQVNMLTLAVLSSDRGGEGCGLLGARNACLQPPLAFWPSIARSLVTEERFFFYTIYLSSRAGS